MLGKKLISLAPHFHLLRMMHLDLMLLGENDGIFLKLGIDDKLGIMRWCQIVAH